MGTMGGCGDCGGRGGRGPPHVEPAQEQPRVLTRAVLSQEWGGRGPVLGAQLRWCPASASGYLPARGPGAFLSLTHHDPHPGVLPSTSRSPSSPGPLSWGPWGTEGLCLQSTCADAAASAGFSEPLYPCSFFCLINN